MSPLVSIIIPAYNAAPWIAETIASACNQTWPHTEIIVIDDGSSDDTLAIARRTSAANVHVHTQPNRGAAAARNHGLRLATGEFIQFLDADDLLAPDKIAAQLESIRSLGPDFAYCARWSRFIRSPDEASFPSEPLCTDASPTDWLITKFTLHAMMHPAAWLIHRSLIERAGPWDESLSLDDDGEYFTRIVLASTGVRHCPAAASFYRSQLHTSLSKRRSAQAWASALRSLASSASCLLKTEDSPRTRSACATALQRFIYEAYPDATVERHRAAQLVRQYGGSALQPSGGPRFEFLRRLFGWKLARRIQKILPAHR